MVSSAVSHPFVPPAAATMVELLRGRATSQPDDVIYIWLADGETEEARMTFADLDRRAREIAASLQTVTHPGDRALLLYPPSLEYIAGYFGCLYAGVIAVPAYPPNPARMHRTLPRLQAIVADSRATVALTSTEIRALAEYVFEDAPDLAALHWIATDEPGPGSAWEEPVLAGTTIAFLQYTSGSTGTPRGVMVTHANLLANLELIRQSFGLAPGVVGVSWLPPYHDMGLIGGLLEVIYVGGMCVLMSPVAFLQRPLRWLRAIHTYRAAVSGGPNFAYDLCVRKTTAEQRAELDLSCWDLAFNGAEPVRAETLRRFSAAFAASGFRDAAHYPCYGMAETTLIVTGGMRAGGARTVQLDPVALGRHQVELVAEGSPGAVELVGCGFARPGHAVVIVDPDTHAICGPEQVGEIWVAGPGVAQGYWEQPHATAATFQAYTQSSGAGPFLRTGDMGFLHQNELFVTGRIKDLIIIDGRNHYPQDLEATAEASHPALRPGCSAVFSVDVAGEERLVVVAEVERSFLAEQRNGKPGSAVVTGAIRRAISEAHELRAYAVMLLRPGSIPKTSSGKIQRHACRTAYLEGSLEVVEEESRHDVPDI